jgi:asparagine synthase (glutamine-hydrolysing)
MSAGLFGFFIKDKKIGQIASLYPEFDSVFHEKFLAHNVVGGKMLNALNKDRFFIEQDGITIAFDGINLTENISDSNDFFQQYRQNGVDFVKQLKGVFVGFILDEHQEKLYIFSDNLATKSLYYYYHPEFGFAFSSSLQVLTKAFRQNQVSYTLNTDAVYMMALYGMVLDNQTYVSEIAKLPYSSILEYDIKQQRLQLEQYHQYHSKKSDISYDKAIDKIEVLLGAAIQKNWAKSKTYSDQYFTLLSGGMDARVNALVAKELGYKNIKSLTFGQSGSKDVLYAEQIAKGEGFDHKSILLDGGDYLIDNIFENYIIPNDGMIFFNGSAHMSSSLKQEDLSAFPIIHSGQIGDVLFGAFVAENFDFKENKSSLGYTGFVRQKDLLDKIESLDSILEKYRQRGYEMYIYEQRQIHATIYGDRSIAAYKDTISPFYDKELIQFCMSLPNAYKKNQIIYFDWLKKYHPQVVQYPWDKINMNPDKHWKIKYGKLFKKYFNGAKKYFHWHYESMNPYGIWLKENPKIIAHLDQILQEELSRKFWSDEMKNDLKKIYADDIFEFRNKFAVITLLLAIRLHFE